MIQFPLRLIREACGYNIEEVASSFGIAQAEYEEIEKDTSRATAGLLLKIKQLFNDVPLELIYPGTESDCIKHNRKRGSKEGQN